MIGIADDLMVPSGGDWQPPERPKSADAKRAAAASAAALSRLSNRCLTSCLPVFLRILSGLMRRY